MDGPDAPIPSIHPPSVVHVSKEGYQLSPPSPLASVPSSPPNGLVNRNSTMKNPLDSSTRVLSLAAEKEMEYRLSQKSKASRNRVDGRPKTKRDSDAPFDEDLDEILLLALPSVKLRQKKGETKFESKKTKVVIQGEGPEDEVTPVKSRPTLSNESVVVKSISFSNNGIAENVSTKVTTAAPVKKATNSKDVKVSPTKLAAKDERRAVVVYPTADASDSGIMHPFTFFPTQALMGFNDNALSPVSSASSCSSEGEDERNQPDDNEDGTISLLLSDAVYYTGEIAQTFAEGAKKLVDATTVVDELIRGPVVRDDDNTIPKRLTPTQMAAEWKRLKKQHIQKIENAPSNDLDILSHNEDDSFVNGYNDDEENMSVEVISKGNSKTERVVVMDAKATAVASKSKNSTTVGKGGTVGATLSAWWVEKELARRKQVKKGINQDAPDDENKPVSRRQAARSAIATSHINSGDSEGKQESTMSNEREKATETESSLIGLTFLVDNDHNDINKMSTESDVRNSDKSMKSQNTLESASTDVEAVDNNSVSKEDITSDKIMPNTTKKESTQVDMITRNAKDETSNRAGKGRDGTNHEAKRFVTLVESLSQDNNTKSEGACVIATTQRSLEAVSKPLKGDLEVKECKASALLQLSKDDVKRHKLVITSGALATEVAAADKNVYDNQVDCEGPDDSSSTDDVPPPPQRNPAVLVDNEVDVTTAPHLASPLKGVAESHPETLLNGQLSELVLTSSPHQIGEIGAADKHVNDGRVDCGGSGDNSSAGDVPPLPRRSPVLLVNNEVDVTTAPVAHSPLTGVIVESHPECLIPLNGQVSDHYQVADTAKAIDETSSNRNSNHSIETSHPDITFDEAQDYHGGKSVTSMAVTDRVSGSDQRRGIARKSLLIPVIPLIPLQLNAYSSEAITENTVEPDVSISTVEQFLYHLGDRLSRVLDSVPSASFSKDVQNELSPEIADAKSTSNVLETVIADAATHVLPVGNDASEQKPINQYEMKGGDRHEIDKLLTRSEPVQPSISDVTASALPVIDAIVHDKANTREINTRVPGERQEEGCEIAFIDMDDVPVKHEMKAVIAFTADSEAHNASELCRAPRFDEEINRNESAPLAQFPSSAQGVIAVSSVLSSTLNEGYHSVEVDAGTRRNYLAPPQRPGESSAAVSIEVKKPDPMAKVAKASFVNVNPNVGVLNDHDSHAITKRHVRHNAVQASNGEITSNSPMLPVADHTEQIGRQKDEIHTQASAESQQKGREYSSVDKEDIALKHDAVEAAIVQALPVISEVRYQTEYSQALHFDDEPDSAKIMPVSHLPSNGNGVMSASSAVSSTTNKKFVASEVDNITRPLIPAQSQPVGTPFASGAVEAKAKTSTKDDRRSSSKTQEGNEFNRPNMLSNPLQSSENAIISSVSASPASDSNVNGVNRGALNPRLYVERFGTNVVSLKCNEVETQVEGYEVERFDTEDVQTKYNEANAFIVKALHTSDSETRDQPEFSQVLKHGETTNVGAHVPPVLFTASTPPVIAAPSALSSAADRKVDSMKVDVVTRPYVTPPPQFYEANVVRTNPIVKVERSPFDRAHSAPALQIARERAESRSDVSRQQACDSSDNSTVFTHGSEETEPQSNIKPTMIRTLDDVSGIAKGDIVLSLLNGGLNQSQKSPTGGAQVRDALMRMKEMRKRQKALERDKGNPGPAIPLQRSPSRRSALPVDVDNMRVVGGVKHIKTLEDDAIEHLKRDEVEEALELYEDIIYTYAETFKDMEYRRVLDQSAFGGSNERVDFRPYVGNALHNIGILHFMIGDYSDALSFLERAAESRKTYLGHGHSEHLTSLTKIALCHYALDNFEEAHKGLENVMMLSKKIQPDLTDLMQMAEILNNLGCLFSMCGQPGTAMKRFTESIEVQEAVLTHSLYDDTQQNGHSTILNITVTKGNIGYLLFASNDTSAAILAFESSLMRQQLLLDGAHETLIATMDHLAVANLRLKNKEKALKLLQRVHRAQLDAYGPTDERCAISLQKIKLLQRLEQNFEAVVNQIWGAPIPSSIPSSIVALDLESPGKKTAKKNVLQKLNPIRRKLASK